jgi:hypothetical protein
VRGRMARSCVAPARLGLVAVAIVATAAGIGSDGSVRLRPCAGANDDPRSTLSQRWVMGEADGTIMLAGADLWLALAPNSAQVAISRNKSHALAFEFLPAGRGQRGAEAWIRTTGEPKGQPGGLCLNDDISTPSGHTPKGLPAGGIFLGGCDDMDGAETWVENRSDAGSTLESGSVMAATCLTAVDHAAAAAASATPPRIQPTTATGAVNRAAAGGPVATITHVHANGWAAKPGSGIRVTEGWGYMDQNVLHIRNDHNGETTVTYAALFFPCDAADPTSKWLLYCTRVWRSSDGAQSPVLQLGGGGPGGSASSPPSARETPVLLSTFR